MYGRYGLDILYLYLFDIRVNLLRFGKQCCLFYSCIVTKTYGLWVLLVNVHSIQLNFMKPNLLVAALII